ncbi:hypothetical protein [Caldicellulosiruptor kronotskyensis]|uniref:hypothetical protein n=1 Tax=Caldicellulosiruptor kronotskyensis TaxID=413889 RepID=UPI0001E9B267|nr:hypothetical protein [Caldicellulosiruptor kronotskyensis]
MLNDKIYPGCKLYHRGNYIRDKESSYGEVIVVDFDGEYIKCKTSKGIKVFRVDSIGKNLFFSEDEISDVVMLTGESHIPLDELKYYINDEKDKIFIEEKTFFDNVKSKLQEEYKKVSEEFELLKYGFNDFSDSFTNSFDKYTAVLQR